MFWVWLMQILAVCATTGAVVACLMARRSFRKQEALAAQREARLPAATRLADVEARAKIAGESLERLEQRVGDAQAVVERREAAERWLGENEEKLESLKVDREEQRQLERQVASLRESAKALGERHQRLSHEASTCEMELERNQSRVVSLSQELRLTQEKLEAQRRGLAELEAQRAHLEPQVARQSALAAVLPGMEKKVEALGQSRRELEDALAQAQRERDAAEAARARAQEARDEAAERMRSVVASRDELEKQTQSLEERLGMLRKEAEQLEEIQAQVTALREAHAEIHAARDEIEQDREKADQERRRIKAKLHETQAGLDDRQARLDGVAEDLRRLTAQRDELTTVIARKGAEAAEVAALRDEAKTLREQRMEVRTEMDEAQLERQRIEGELERERTELTRVADEAQRVRTTLDELEASRVRLRAEVAELETTQRRHDELAEAVTTLAGQRGKAQRALAAAQARREHLESEAGAFEQQIEERSARLSEVEETLGASTLKRDGLLKEVAELEPARERYEALVHEIEKRSGERATLLEELAGTQSKRDRLADEVRTLEESERAQRERMDDLQGQLEVLMARKQGLTIEVAELEALATKQERLRSELESDQRARAEVVESLAVARGELEEAKRQAERLTSEARAASESVNELTQRQRALEESCATSESKARAGEQEAGVQAERLSQVNAELDASQAKLSDKRASLESVERALATATERAAGLGERKEQLEATVVALRDRIGAARQATEAVERRANPWAEMNRPALSRDVFVSARDETDEVDCLSRAADYLNGLGLQFSRRTLYAFHTALKVSDVAPLVMLWGVSGSGKSELPARYAQSMGMHLLRVRVGARWAGREDLLGSFTREGERFRPTQLTRALVQMDGRESSSEASGMETQGLETQGLVSLADRMLMVLLEDMTIAPPAYYLGEFLSGLEARQGMATSGAAQRRGAELSFEGDGGSAVGPPGIGLDRNVLLVAGIGLDDGSAGLDGSVGLDGLDASMLDRANVVGLSAGGLAGGLADGPATAGSGAAKSEDDASRYLPFEVWRSWLRDESADEARASGSRVEQWIGELRRAMAEGDVALSGRSVRAIRRYVANYPDRSDAGISAAMADQIELRVMPRLLTRDPSESGCRRMVDGFRKLAEGLGDEVLAAAIDTASRDGAAAHVLAYRPPERLGFSERRPGNEPGSGGVVGGGQSGLKGDGANGGPGGVGDMGTGRVMLQTRGLTPTRANLSRDARG